MAFQSRQHGFTLTELAVVFAIVALLLGSAMFTLSAQVEQRNWRDTERRLEEARELLLGYALVNGRLPCPATCTNAPACTAGSAGDEAPSVVGGGACTTNYAGYLPAKAIGFNPVDTTGFAVDGWGNRIRYAVSATTWSAGTGMFTKAHSNAAWSVTQAPGDLVVCSTSPATATDTTCDAGTSVTNQNTVVAVIFSTGKNGATGGTGTNEARNVDGNQLYVSRSPDPATVATGEFDDQMLWIPVGLLYGRMISAGVLP